MKRDVSANRHDAWGGDAVDAEGATTIVSEADGEVVWFWPPDAEVKLATMLTRIAPMTGARKPVPGEITYKP